MFVDSLVTYYPYSGDSTLIPIVQEMLDYQLAHGTTPPDWDWPSVPFASSRNGDLVYTGDGDPDRDGPNGIEPDKVAELGYAYLRFYQLTGDATYRDAAIRCADALASHMQPGSALISPLPFRVDGQTGAVREAYTANMVAPTRLFDELIRLNLGNVAAYQSARTLAWNWVLTYPMVNNRWNAYYEDTVRDPNLTNFNHYVPVETARYILSRPDPGAVDPQWQTHGPALLTWARTMFGKGPYYSAWAIDEQTECCSEYGMGSHTARWASVNALLYERTGDPLYREDAFRSLNYATYFAREDGVILDVFDSGSPWYSDGYGDYVKHFMAAMGAIPEWAPPAESHLLRSTSVVQTINYSPLEIHYTTFDPAATEVLRMGFAPQLVRANGIALPRRQDLTQEGWVYDDATGVLRIRHDNATDIVVDSGVTPSPTPTFLPGTSLRFDGVNDYVQAGTVSTSTFTVEAWVRPATANSEGILIAAGDSASGWSFELNGGYATLWVLTASGARMARNTAIQLQPDAWHHVAAVYNGADGRVFVNGLGSAMTGLGALIPGSGLTFGGQPGTGFAYFSGWLDDIRISNTSRYSFNFTPPSRPFLLDDATLGLWHLDEGGGQVAYDSSAAAHHGRLGHTTGIDLADPDWDDGYTFGGIPLSPTPTRTPFATPTTPASTPTHTLTNTPGPSPTPTRTPTQTRTPTPAPPTNTPTRTLSPTPTATLAPYGSALSFDGVNDYVQAGNVNASAFTVEAWARPAVVNSNGILIATGGATAGWSLELNNGYATLWVLTSTGARMVRNMALPLQPNIWYHVAAVYSGGNGRVFVNGLGSASANLGVLIPGLGLQFGGQPGTGFAYFPGRLDEIRISDGVRYSSNFTPSNTPFTPDGSTLGLWHLDEGYGQMIYDASASANHGRLGDTPGADTADPAWVDGYPFFAPTFTPIPTATGTAAPTDTPAPPGPCALSASKSGNDVVLTWTASSGATGYNIYRDVTPYFTPGAPLTMTTTLSHTDTSVIGDPAVNHYYLVGAFNLSGETFCAHRVGEFDYALQPGAPGAFALNDLAIALDVSATVTDAESLAVWIETQGNAPFGSVRQLLKWDAPLQTFLAWSHEFGFGDNFPAMVGDAIFLALDENAPYLVSLVGRTPLAGEVNFGLAPGSSGLCALNFLSLPLDQPQLTSADQLSDSIGIPNVTVLQALDWESSLQSFLAWSNEYGFGDDFPTTIGYPYGVCLSATGVPTRWP